MRHRNTVIVNRTVIGKRRLVWFVSTLVVATLALGHHVGFTAPGDVFLTAAPAKSPSLDEKATSEEATHSVGESGTAHYTIPITVPPGRQGMQPKLALSYSSRNPVRGGIAAGWSFDIPRIEVDTSEGRLEGPYYRSTVSGSRLVRAKEPGFPDSVETYRAEQDNSYARYERVRNQDGSTAKWVMRTTDGRTWTFGGTPGSFDAPLQQRTASTPVREGRWFLTQVIDKFDNTIDYTYNVFLTTLPSSAAPAPVDIFPTEILWGRNDAAGLAHHAKAVFSYGEDKYCSQSKLPIGAQFTYRMGFPIFEGAKRLTKITLFLIEKQSNTKPREARSYLLGYDEKELGCPSGMTHAPLRLLTSVREEAIALDATRTALPEIRFGYGRRELDPVERMPSSTPIGAVGSGQNALSLGKAGTWATVDSMLLDFDGDGRLDIIIGGNMGPAGCGISWSRNLGTGNFEDPRPVALPTIPWAGRTRNDAWPITTLDGYNTVEDCTLSYQFSRTVGGVINGKPNASHPASYLSYRFMDVTGDGRPDLVTAIDANQVYYWPQNDRRLWPSAKPFPACFDQGPCRDSTGKPMMCKPILTSPPGMGPVSVTPKPTAPAPPPAGEPNGTTSFLAIPSGPVSPLVPRTNTQTLGIMSRAIDGGSGGSTSGGAGGLSPNQRYTRCWNQEKLSFAIVEQGKCAGGLWELIYDPVPFESRTYEVGAKPNKDPLLNGAAMWPEYGCGRYVLRVYENTGLGFNPEPRIILSPLPLETDRDTSNVGAGHLAASSPWHGFLDMDGDGLLDAVYKVPNALQDAPGLQPSAVPLAQLRPVFYVFRGDGSGNFRGDRQGNPYTWRAPALPATNATFGHDAARVKLQGAVRTDRPTGGVLAAPVPHPKDTVGTGTPGGTGRPAPNFVQESFTKVTLQDINGDGLPDYIDTRFSPQGSFDTAQGHVHIFYNTGTGFESSSIDLPTFRGHTLETDAWGSERYRYFETSSTFYFQPQSPGYKKRNIWSRQTTQVIDIDADGLLDVVVIEAPQIHRSNPWAIGPLPKLVVPLQPPSPPSPSSRLLPGTEVAGKPTPSTPLPIVARLFVNVGDKLVPMGQTEKLAKWWPALARITIGGSDTAWYLATDFTDLDGDGLPDLATGAETLLAPTDYQGAMRDCVPNALYGDFSCHSPYFGSLRTPHDGQGMRLLRTVENGRGGRVQFEYKPLPTKRLFPVVKASAGAATPSFTPAAQPQPEPEGRVPYPLWVVSQVTVNAGVGAGSPSADQLTTYDYQRPVYNQDHHGDWGFRGFGQVGVTGPTGAVTITTYDHALHWGGLPIAVRVFDSLNGRPHSVTKTVWGRDALFNNSIANYHHREVERRTCAAAQSLQDCEANGAPRFVISQWVPQAPTVTPPQGTSTPIMYVEEGLWTGENRNAPNTPGSQGRRSSFQLVSTPTDYRLVSSETQRYLAGLQPPMVGATIHRFDPTLREERQTEERIDATKVATTARTYDRTGNVETVTQPNGAVTRFMYDPRKLVVSRTTNALGHIVNTAYDLATGVQLSSRGPNAKEGWQRTIDGFGRVREEKVLVDQSSTPIVIVRNQFVDTPSLNGHAGVIAQKRIDLDQDRWTKTTAEVDGLGRVVATTVSNAANAPLSVSRYRYDKAGQLWQADLPAPNQSPGTETVTYTLTYDAQGRPHTALRPDGTGQQWTYDATPNGRWTTRADVLKTNKVDPATKSGVLSRTKTRIDAWEHLAETHEQLSDGSWAITRYDYDGNDNVRRITNADGLVTDMQHDWLSRRVAVTRAVGTPSPQKWLYGYDLNGNMTSIQAPLSHGATLTMAPLYTTTIGYDILDRPTTRHAGRRNIQPDKLLLYGLIDQQEKDIPTQYGYDAGPNGIGRLTSVTASNLTTTFSYDARGLLIGEQRTFNIGGNIQGNRRTSRTYNALGALRTLTFADGVTQQESTTITYQYDDRGLPAHVDWQGRELGRSSYTAAGGLASRGTSTHCLIQTYDILGRVEVQQVIQAACGQQNAAVLANQRYHYTDSDDVAVLDTTVGGRPAQWQFSYDTQHQLLAATGSVGYQGAFRYSPAGRIVFASVATQLPNPSSRTVTYDYAAGDPEAPDTLKLANGTEWMRLQYDSTGNVISRAVSAQPQSLVWQHVYDGGDLQREVIAPNGMSELYWYDHERQRALVVSKAASGNIERVRWTVGDTEIWYDGRGNVLRTIASIPFNGVFARIERMGNQVKPRLLFQNTRGDVQLVIDQQAPPVAEFAYGPYGETLHESGTDAASVLERFNGKGVDGVSGLSYYGYRYYDGRSLTWTQADPFYRFAPDIAKDNPRRLASYAFSLNNPLRYMDPNGLDSAASAPYPRPKVCPKNAICTPDVYQSAVPVVSSQQTDCEREGRPSHHCDPQTGKLNEQFTHDAKRQEKYHSKVPHLPPSTPKGGVWTAIVVIDEHKYAIIAAALTWGFGGAAVMAGEGGAAAMPGTVTWMGEKATSLAISTGNAVKSAFIEKGIEVGLEAYLEGKVPDVGGALKDVAIDTGLGVSGIDTLLPFGTDEIYLDIVTNTLTGR